MDWLDLLQDVLKVCVIPLLGLLTGYVIKWLKAKEEEVLDQIDNDVADRYVALLFETITDCVRATTQTYVDALKKENAFTPEAQKEAFNMTYKAVMSILTDDVKEYLSLIYGDLTVFITNKIEAEVKAQK